MDAFRVNWKTVKPTPRQRENLGKAFLNAANAILVAWVLTNALGHILRPRLILAGLGLYVLAVLAALWIDR